MYQINLNNCIKCPAIFFFLERDAHRETERENERKKEKGYVLYECNEPYI